MALILSAFSFGKYLRSDKILWIASLSLVSVISFSFLKKKGARELPPEFAPIYFLLFGKSSINS